jgi:hypothetical protein
VRKLRSVAGFVLLLFGLACLNYTRADGWEHHVAFARAHHVPEPSNSILLAGVVAVGLGSATIGFALGSRVRRNVDVSAAAPASRDPTNVRPTAPA